MTHSYLDIKLMLLNFLVFMISFSNVEAFIRVILLLVTIGYTCHKWYSDYKEKNVKKRK